MGLKRIRRNYYKNSVAKRRNKIMQRLIFYIKTTAVVTVLLVVSFLFIFSYDFITQCDYFKADRLVVTGKNRLSEKQVLQQIQIKKGMNIFSLNLSKARKRLLAHSWIAEAEVSRELPSGINIRIKEHKPLAILDLGRKFIINTSGEIFKEMAVSDPEHLPIISGLRFSDINVRGKPLSTPLKAVMNVMELGQKSESVIPYKQLRSIQVDREMGLTIYAFDRVKAIKIGYNNYPDKYAKLKNVLLYLKKRRGFSHIESIDLNNLNRIVVSPMKRKASSGNYKEV